MHPQPYKLPSETTVYFSENKLTDFFLEIGEYDDEHHVKLAADEYILTVRGTYYNNYVCRPVQAVLDLLVDLDWDLTDTMFHIAYRDKSCGYLMAKRINAVKSVWLADLKGLDKNV